MYNGIKKTRGKRMYIIFRKIILTPLVSQLDIVAPWIITHAKPGQFVMIRVTKDGERIPLTIAGIDPVHQTVSIIFQVVGATTHELNQLNEGDAIEDIAGPLGRPSDLEHVKKAIVIGGGVGCAIAYPIAKALVDQKASIHTIVGFRTKELVFMEDDFKSISDSFDLLTDDGSYSRKGRVTDRLQELLKSGEKVDLVIAIGPLQMMKAVSEMTKPYGIRTTVSMNPIMVDGTGMCGGCRVKVGKEMKFACVDGPEFDGHQVDFDAAILRNRMYEDDEKEHYASIRGVDGGK